MIFAYLHNHPDSNKDAACSNRIIIKLKQELPPAGKLSKARATQQAIQSIDELNKSLGIEKMELLFSERPEDLQDQYLSNIYVIQCPAGMDPQEAASRYASLPSVEYAQPDYQLELYDWPNDPLYIIQWPLNNMGQSFPQILWMDGLNNDSLIMVQGSVDADIDGHEVLIDPPDSTNTVVVALIDTGVDSLHSELSGKIWHNPGEIPDNSIDDDHNGFVDDYWGWDFTGDNSTVPPLPDNDPSDELGHGTHCAGIIAAASNNNEGIAGILSDCKIMSVKFYPVMLSSYAARGIIYAADNGADVINLSFGYPWSANILEEAINYARAKGVIICAATGNDGGEYENYPGSYDGVISVGASTVYDQVAFFSTYGNYMDVIAPGYSILSLRAAGTDMYAPNEPNIHIINDYYYLASGTSMASPHVAAVAAYLRALSPGLKPDNVQQIIQETCDDLVDPFGYGQDLPGWDKYSGYGRINLYNAIQAVPLTKAILANPRPNQIISGTIDIIGTVVSDSLAGYSLKFGAGNLPDSWTEIISSPSPYASGILGSFNTDSLNGRYTLKLNAGGINEKLVTVNVANSPISRIIYPTANDSVSAMVPIEGSALCPGFDHYILEYGAGFSPSTWYQIKYATAPAWQQQLAIWDINSVRNGIYSLCLKVFSAGGLSVADTVRIYVKSDLWGNDSWKIGLDNMISLVPNYGDLDGDGQNEIILGTDAGILFFNPNGTLKTDNVPQVPNYNFRLAPAVGDINGDGVDDLVAIGLDFGTGKLLGFPSDGEPFETYLLRAPDIGMLNTDLEYIYPSVFLKDFDNDGRDEIFYYDNPDCWIYESDGSFIMHFPTFPAAVPRHYLSADIDGDGLDEFYVSNDYICQFDRNGNYLRCLPLSMGLGTNFCSRSLTAADIDGDGKLELIVLGRFMTEAGNYWIYAFDEDLTLKPGWPRNTHINSFLVPPAPIFGDIDGDGGLEYFLSFFELVQGMIYGWNIDGSPYSGFSANPVFASTNDPGRIYYSLMADINGDTYPEIISSVKDDIFDSYNVERIEAWDKNGNELENWPIITRPASITCLNYGNQTPTIGDINKDGNIDLLTVTPQNELLFINFEDAPYDPAACPVKFWRYNRRMNNIANTRLNFICGDIDGDNICKINDAVSLVNYLFIPGLPAPDRLQNGDTNCDDKINLVDIVWIINFIFRGGYDPCDMNGDGIPDC